MNRIDLFAPFRVPLQMPFRRVRERAGVLLHGPAGWGEFSPFPEYPTEVAAQWYAAAHEAAVAGWPPPVRRRVPVNAIVPAVGPEQAHDLVVAAGCSTVKVKVAEPGEDLGHDIARCEAVRAALGTHGALRVDANGAWDVDQAVTAIRALDAYDLEYVEQPVGTLDEMAVLRRRVDVPLAADESIRTADDPLHVARVDAADVIVVKVQPLGGVRRALEVVERAGLPAVVSSAVETSVGLAAGVALAAALPELPYACGLGTARLLAGDVVGDPLMADAGWLEVRRPSPRDDLLQRWRPDDADAARLVDRLHLAADAYRDRTRRAEQPGDRCAGGPKT